MDAILMNFDNSITTDPHRLLINNLNKINLKINMLRYQTLAFTIHEKTSKKKSYENNKFKISAPTWIEEFELPDRSYSVSDIQDCFKYILKT